MKEDRPQFKFRFSKKKRGFYNLLKLDKNTKEIIKFVNNMQDKSQGDKH